MSPYESDHEHSGKGESVRVVSLSIGVKIFSIACGLVLALTLPGGHWRAALRLALLSCSRGAAPPYDPPGRIDSVAATGANLGRALACRPALGASLLLKGGGAPL